MVSQKVKSKKFQSIAYILCVFFHSLVAQITSSQIIIFSPPVRFTTGKTDREKYLISNV